MKLTEKQLRNIVKSVIKETDEPDDLTDEFDELTDADAIHEYASETANDFAEQFVDASYQNNGTDAERSAMILELTDILANVFSSAFNDFKQGLYASEEE